MLIAISGTQGCGKSTVLKALADKGYTVVERKTARSVLQEWNRSLDEIYRNNHMTKQFQEEILERKIQDELQYRNTDQIVFTERSYTDLMVYSTLLLGRFNEYNDWLDAYYWKCVAGNNTYSFVCHLDPFIDPNSTYKIDDGVRGVNYHYGKLVEATMLQFADGMPPQHMLRRFNETTTEDRVNSILQWINYYKI